MIEIWEIGPDWWAGETEAEVLEAWMAEYDLEVDDLGGYDEPRLLTYEEADRLMIFDDDGNPTRNFNCEVGWLIRQGEKFPRLIASTEW